MSARLPVHIRKSMKQDHIQVPPVDTSFALSWRDERIAVRVFGRRPRSASASAPMLVYFHGGLFNCGALTDAEPFAKALSNVAVVACIDYPLAPAFQFPETMEVAFEALRWASANAAGFGADSAKLIVAGDQAGGNLAACAAMVARDRNASSGPAVAGQILLTPILDPSQASGSMRAAADCPCRKGWSQYLPFVSDASHPYAAPVHSRRLGGLPPALIVTAELDPMRDEAEEYAAKLISFGVPVQVRRLDSVAGNVVSLGHSRFDAVVEAASNFVSAFA